MIQIFNTLSQNRQGEIIMVLAVLLFSWSPIINLTLGKNLSPWFMVWAVNFCAALFLAAWMTKSKRWPEFFNCQKGWLDVLISTLIIGIAFYVVLFWAQQHTSAANGAILGLSQIFFTFLTMSLLGFEAFRRSALIGAVLLVLGAGMVAYKPGMQFSIGDLGIFFAFLLPAFGNIFGKRARQHMRAKNLLFLRCFIATVLLSPLLLIENVLPTAEQVIPVLWLLIGYGVIIFAIEKILWIEAMHRISISKCAALTTFGPLCTLVYLFFGWGQIPSILQILGMIPMIIGAWVILYDPSAFRVLKR